MNKKQLHFFVGVVEAGSFAEAARRLGVAQPALSRQVKLLEEALNARLLTRSVRGVSLTEAGERLFHHARGIIEQFEVLPQVVAGGDIVTGRVSIGLPHSASAVLALPLLREVARRLPLVQIHLLESVSGFLQEWVETGRLDLAILFDADCSPSVRLDSIAVEDLYLVGHADAPILAESTVPFARLNGCRLLLPGAPHAHRRLLDALALSNGIRLDIAMEVDSLSVTLALVAETNVFAILARGAVQSEIDNRRLAASRVVQPSLTRSVALATSPVRASNLACQALRQLVLDTCRTLASSGHWPVTLSKAD